MRLNSAGLRGVLGCLLLAASVQLFAQISPEVKDTANKLAGSVYTGPSMETLRELSDGFGGRLSGSPAHNRAAEWAAAKFRSFGIQNVRLEPFNIPNGWQRGSARGEMLAPLARPLHIESLGWAPSTPGGGVKGEVVVLDDVSEDNIKAKADTLKGKIVLLDTEKIFANGWMKVLGAVMAAPQHLKDAGAVGTIFPERTKNNVIGATSLD